MTTCARRLLVPEISAVLVHSLDPAGNAIGKASGCLFRLDDSLFLLTNWHVATNRYWTSLAENRQAKRQLTAPPRWASQFQFEPAALRVTVRIGKRQRLLRVLDLVESLSPDDSGSPAYAWEPGTYLWQGLGL